MSDAGFEERLLARHEKRKVKLANAPVREARVETAHVAGVKRRGGASLKFTSPGLAGVPDRIDLFGVKPMVAELRRIYPGIRLGDEAATEFCKALLAAGIKFTELKRPGGKPEPHQLRVHASLRDLGFEVDVKDVVEKL